MHAPAARSGFTLIEILVVISIIALLTALLLPTIHEGQRQTFEAVAKTEVMSLAAGLESYVADEGEYPALEGEPVAADTNHYPALHRALLGEPRPRGPGGRAAPYARVEEARVAVADGTEGGYRRARRDELADDGIAKHFLDPWGNPYIYRPNRGQTRQPFMHHPGGADIYSVGGDAEDDTALGDEGGDDIGNW